VAKPVRGASEYEKIRTLGRLAGVPELTSAARFLRFPETRACLSAPENEAPAAAMDRAGAFRQLMMMSIHPAMPEGNM
jgi:hypothetical protein